MMTFFAVVGIVTLSVLVLLGIIFLLIAMEVIS